MTDYLVLYMEEELGIQPEKEIFVAQAVNHPFLEGRILTCPFEQCAKNFTSQSNFTSHMRRHLKPIVCKVCDNEFLTIQDYNRHRHF